MKCPRHNSRWTRLAALAVAVVHGSALAQYMNKPPPEDPQWMKLHFTEISAGVFAEPAGATAYAGLAVAKSKGWLETEGPILVMNTGSGLKDVRAAMQAVSSAPIIEPTLEAVRKLL